MSLQRIIIEMGTGNDLYGQDYTKAACRAVFDALHHSSITLFRTLDVDYAEMRVVVTIGVQAPDAVDHEQVAACLPHGLVAVRVVKGGLDVPDREHDTNHIVATAAVEAFLPKSALEGWRARG